MKTRMNVMIIVALLIFVSLCSQTAFCKMGMWKGLTCFGYLAFPPKDLYNYRILSPISFTDNEIEEFEFQNKYLGIHHVGILFENPSSYDFFLRTFLSMIQR